MQQLITEDTGSTLMKFELKVKEYPQLVERQFLGDVNIFLTFCLDLIKIESIYEIVDSSMKDDLVLVRFITFGSSQNNALEMADSVFL